MWQWMSFNSIPLLASDRFTRNFRALGQRDFQQIASAHGPLIRSNLEGFYDMMSAIPYAERAAQPPLPAMFRL